MMIVKWLTKEGNVEWGLAKDIVEANELSELVKQRGGYDISRYMVDQHGTLNMVPDVPIETVMGNTAAARPEPPSVPEEAKAAPGSVPARRKPAPRRRKIGTTRTMKEMRDVDSGEWYKTMSPLSLARRLYGTKVEVKLEQSPAHHPTYRMWLVVKGGAILGKIYEPIYQYEEEKKEEAEE